MRGLDRSVSSYDTNTEATIDRLLCINTHDTDNRTSRQEKLQIHCILEYTSLN
jgi:hypothetical protein